MFSTIFEVFAMFKPSSASAKATVFFPKALDIILLCINALLSLRF